MEREVRPRGYTGAELPSDAEKRRYIAEERRKDLASILSPEELRDYDLRYSQTAQNIRWQLAGMKPTLEEYAAIYDARAAVEQDFDTSAGGERSDDFWKKRREAEAAATAKLRATLGEDRFIDYALSNDYASRQITAATERYGLPPTPPASSGNSARKAAARASPSTRTKTSAATKRSPSSPTSPAAPARPFPPPHPRRPRRAQGQQLRHLDRPPR